ncbi:MAG TPA: Ig-like domain-containing protein, partial [Candidatus Ozemobacteraceae bacterium]|nr:Ig-like domain-containing protein [Candidatus Ozemobacteraceae bacterium]
STNDRGEAVIALDSAPYIERSSAGDAATYTMRFATTGLKPGDIASRIIIRWNMAYADGLVFVRELVLNLIEAVQSQEGSTSSPKLAVVAPSDGSTDVPAYTPLELTFDRDMDRASVIRAVRISPLNGVAEAVWTDSRHVLLTYPQAWPAGELLTVTVATSAKSLAGAELAQEYSWSFSIRETAGDMYPTLVTMVPASGTQNLPLNARIWLTFSKPMQHSPVESAISAVQPALASLTFEWSSGSRNVGILPATNWPAQTSFLFEIARSAADTDGLLLASSIRFVFHTHSESGPTVTMTDPAPNSVLATMPRSLAFKFSRSMNKTLTTNAFSVSPAPAGTPSYTWASADSQLTITWPGTFAEASEVTASFSAAARDTLNLPLAGTMVFGFTTRDMTPPTILSVAPREGSSGIPRNTPIELTFSEAMKRTSVESSVLVTPSSGGLSYAWNADGTILTIKPATGWPADSQITLSIGTNAADSSGNGLAAQFNLAFRSSALQAPELAASIPVSGSTGVGRTAPLTLAFTQPMMKSSLTEALSITPAPAAGISIAWSSDATVATVTPSPSWANAAEITVKLGNAAKSTTGVSLPATATIVFSTSDTEPPAVVSLVPANGATRVSPTASFTISFTEPMNEADVRGAISLSPAAPGSLRSRMRDSGRQFEFSWSQSLTDLTAYTLTIGTGARDKAGNALLQVVSSRFTTTDTTSPVIASTWPTPGATGVPSGTSLLVDFSKTMDPNGVTVSLSPLPS